MKKYLNGLILFSIIILIGCTKNNSNNREENEMQMETTQLPSDFAQTLSNDSEFIVMANDMFDFLIFVKEVSDRNNLDLTIVKSEQESMQMLDLSTDEEIDYINSVFQEDVSTKFADHSIVFYTNWTELTNR